MRQVYRFKYKSYQRHFRSPLQTSQGIWRVRQGIIISLMDETGKVGRGEIAPLPQFGSETLAQALEFCQQLGATIAIDEIYGISDRLPSCQFAFESALLNLSSKSDRPTALDYSYLLPAGKHALTAWQNISQPHFNTFKWKIGVLPITEEITIFHQLVRVLPPTSKLRLDANGGLTIQQARQWLEETQATDTVEFIEQPLPPANFVEMLSLRREYTTAIALDESVASFHQLKEAYQRGWKGIFTVKAAIMGYPSRLLTFCREKAVDAVFSSVFETEIGRQAVLDLAAKLKSDRAVGFGVEHWF
ncbi:o-succinylbenzoate synthase [Myxosarcina sp. GI1(2024)]